MADAEAEAGAEAEADESRVKEAAVGESVCGAPPDVEVEFELNEPLLLQRALPEDEQLFVGLLPDDELFAGL